MYIFTCKFLWVRLKVLRVENVFDEEVAFFLQAGKPAD